VRHSVDSRVKTEGLCLITQGSVFNFCIFTLATLCKRRERNFRRH